MSDQDSPLPDPYMERLYQGEPSLRTERPDPTADRHAWRTWFNARVRCQTTFEGGGRCYNGREPHDTVCVQCQARRGFAVVQPTRDVHYITVGEGEPFTPMPGTSFVTIGPPAATALSAALPSAPAPVPQRGGAPPSQALHGVAIDGPSPMRGPGDAHRRVLDNEVANRDALDRQSLAMVSPSYSAHSLPCHECGSPDHTAQQHGDAYRASEPRCGKYIGDNDATCPQLTCIRPRGHTGLCDNTSAAPDPLYPPHCRSCGISMPGEVSSPDLQCASCAKPKRRRASRLE